MSKEFSQILGTIAGAEGVKMQEPMKLHTTFRIGGPADYYVCPDTIEKLHKIIEACKKEEMPYFILGNGSNLLVSDAGYHGVVIQIYRNLNGIRTEGNSLIVQAGALLSQAARTALDAGLGGFEFAAGIPGTLGGAVVMNAGAYGGEMKDVLREVTVLDHCGEIRRIPVEELALGYRTSVIKTAGYVVLEAVLGLEKKDPAAIAEKMNELKERRVSKQPLEYPSAGSTFKRPEGYFAGKLIMDAGLRGYSCGGAQVSEKHCGFVINKGNATAEDVRDLIAHVTAVVQEKFGVTLETEVKFLGEF